MNIILKPFAMLLTLFYNLFNNYGLALILFALVVKVLLFPFSLKGKRSMVKMTSLQGKAARLQKQYANNKAKYNEELQNLYAKEKVNPMSGCLWSFIPLLFLLPLYAIIRQPLTYMMNMTTEQIVQVGNSVLNWAQTAFDNHWIGEAAQLTAQTASAGYNELYLSSLINADNLTQVQAVAPGAFAINFQFLGMNLAQVPAWKFWAHPLNWNNIGLTLMPIFSAALSLLMSFVTQKTNNISGQQQPQSAGTNMMMYLLGPVMSLWIGYAMPAGLCVYWIINSVASIGQEFLTAKLLKKDYEAAAEAQRKQELLDKEEEKRRKAALAAERARRAEEKKQKGKKKGKDKEKDKAPGADNSASRVGIRAYARGRAYDPARYGEVTPYRDPDHPVDEEAVEAARARKEERAEEAALEAEVTAKVAQEMETLSAGTVEDVAKAIQESEAHAAQETDAEAEALARTVTEDAPETAAEDAPETLEEAAQALDAAWAEATEAPDQAEAPGEETEETETADQPSEKEE